MSDRGPSLRLKYNARIFPFVKTSGRTTTASGSKGFLKCVTLLDQESVY